MAAALNHSRKTVFMNKKPESRTAASCDTPTKRAASLEREGFSG